MTVGLRVVEAAVKTRHAAAGCMFERQGRGDHEIWFTPISGKAFTVHGAIQSRPSPDKTLEDAWLDEAS
ncbi:MAG: type II toxin-antitoxin system HicA family toxin [Salinarimonas sp.]